MTELNLTELNPTLSNLIYSKGSVMKTTIWDRYKDKVLHRYIVNKVSSNKFGKPYFWVGKGNSENTFVH